MNRHILCGLTLAAMAMAAVGQPATATEQTPTTADIARMLMGRASSEPPQACIKRLANAITNPSAVSGQGDPFADLLDAGTSPLCATYLILSSRQFAQANTASGGKLLAAAEEKFEGEALKTLKAVAQQNGSSTGTGGSTSLTSKGMTSKLLSIASEYGALTESTSNDTTTVQGTLAGVPLVLMQKGALVECSTKILALTPCLHQGLLKWLSRTSYSVSFETSSSAGTIVGTPTGGTPSSGPAQQVNVSNQTHSVNAVSAKVVLIQGTLNASAYSNADTAISKSTSIAAVASAQSALKAAEGGYGGPFFTYIQNRAAHLRQFTTNHTQSAVVGEWKASADDLTAALVGPQTTLAQVLQDAVDLAVAYSSYLGAEESAGLAAMVAVPPALSVEYDENRPPAAPSNSVFRAILQKSFKPLTATANGAVSIYDSAQPNVPGAGRLRDAQFATELSHPFDLTLPGSTSTQLTLSGAFYDQYQSSPAILNVTPGAPVDGVTFTGLPSTATQVYGKTGNIAIGQVKLTVGGGSSVTVPLSLTYSNRTELITSPTWKAQIGLSYDFDSLFSGGK
jgi:hypothetical protein